MTIQTPPLRRPKILIRAATLGQKTYKRDSDLRRLFHWLRLPKPQAVIDQLLADEARMDDLRKQGDADYDSKRHIALLTALIGEWTRLTLSAPEQKAA